MKIIILIPIYNDWQSATRLLENINNEVSGIDHTFSIILVKKYLFIKNLTASQNASVFSFLPLQVILLPLKKIFVEVNLDKSLIFWSN